MLSAIEAGAAGFLLRPLANRERLTHVIAGVRRGGTVLPPDFGPGVPAPQHDGACPDPAAPAPALTARELEVLRLLAEGCDTAEIAQRLAYSEPTIKNVIQRLFERLQARNRPHAVPSRCGPDSSSSPVRASRCCCAMDSHNDVAAHSEWRRPIRRSTPSAARWCAADRDRRASR